MKLNLRTIDLNLLTIFDAIMLEKKMSSAARRLNMTQPAVSQALARLRSTVGDDLFIRTHTGMKPTTRAKALAGPVRDILAQIQEAFDPELNFNPSQSTRNFKIAFGPYGEFNLLPDLLSKVHLNQTDINIQSIATGKGISLLKTGDLDFCFIPTAVKDPGIECVKYTNTEFVIIARKNHPRLQHSLSLKDYAKEKHIIVRTNNFTLTQRQTFVHKDLFEIRKARAILAEVNNIAVMPLLVSQTNGIASLPRETAEFFQNQHAINIFPFPMQVPSTSFYLTWHKSLNRDKGHQWLREIILQDRHN